MWLGVIFRWHVVTTWLYLALAVVGNEDVDDALTRLGNNRCAHHEEYNTTKKIRVKEPVTIRTYEWCMKVPPRCSRYHTEIRDIDKVQNVTSKRLVIGCCPGYQKVLDDCIPDTTCEDCGNLVTNSSKTEPTPRSSPVAERSAEVSEPGDAAEGAATPYSQQLTLTDAPSASLPPPHFSAAAEITAQQKGAVPAAAYPKKDTRLNKKGGPDKGVGKEKPVPAESGPLVTEAPEADPTPPLPTPPPLPPELDLPPPLDMPPVPSMSEYNQSLTVGVESHGSGRSGRRRIPPDHGLLPSYPDVPVVRWTIRPESVIDQQIDDSSEETSESTIHGILPPDSASKESISKSAPKKKAIDVKEVPAYARKTATPPPTHETALEAPKMEKTDSVAPEEGAWEPWGRHPAAKELQPGESDGVEEPPERSVYSGHRRAAHAKRGRGEDLKGVPLGKDPGVGLLVMGDAPEPPLEAPPPTDEPTMPTWLPVAIGASALVVIVVVSVSAAVLARGRRRYVSGAAGGPAMGTVELRPLGGQAGCGPGMDGAVSTPTTMAAPVFLSPVFMQSPGAAPEAVGVEPRAGGGQGLILAAVLSPSHQLCTPRTSSFMDPMQATYDVPPPPQTTGMGGTLRRDGGLGMGVGVGGLQLQHMCTTPPPLCALPQEPQHVYEELPLCWQRTSAAST